MIEYVYLSNDYYATGEGRTICLLITRAYPRQEDYDGNSWEANSKLIRTPTEIGKREFEEKFGDWMTFGVESYIREEFIQKFNNLIPATVLKEINNDSEDVPGNFNWFSQLHMNFS